MRKKISINRIEEINKTLLSSKEGIGVLATFPDLTNIPKHYDNIHVTIFKYHITIENSKDLLSVYILSEDYILENGMFLYECIFNTDK